MHAIKKPVIAFIFGAIAVFGFAPLHLYPLTILSLAGLFYLVAQAQHHKQAAWLGYCFGLGFFGTGVSWVYVSLHTYGGMPMLMAALFCLLFCAFLALFHAGFAYFSRLSSSTFFMLPLVWVLGEWIRSWIFTGFPWLHVGYSQIPNSPLAGFAPILGVYGVSCIVAGLASFMAYLLSQPSFNQRKCAMVIISLWLTGSLLKQVEWTNHTAKPFTATLVQGNIPQQQKWQPDAANHIMQQYFNMVKTSQAKLIVLPESAMPVLWSDVPQYYLAALAKHAKSNAGDILIGAIEDHQENYFNSLVSIGTSSEQYYRKSHLVPFGEFIPLKSLIGFIYRDWLNMPLSDLASGEIPPKVMHVAGSKIAANICYEDAFGEEIIRQLPEAEVLVNVSNMAWFGHSWAADQHLQMSQARALETGRMMLRATNTGASAVINHHGEVLAKLPYFKTATLETSVQPYSGSTPYVRWGNWPVLLGFLAYFLFLITKKVAIQNRQNKQR
jgi:apolipoprotein N-acyltransferase